MEDNTALRTYQFDADTKIVAEQVSSLIQNIAPACVLSETDLRELTYEDSASILQEVDFYRIISCAADRLDEIQVFLQNKMTKFYTVVHTLRVPVIYGVISYEGTTNLVIGVKAGSSASGTFQSIMKGLLNGIVLEKFTMNKASLKDHIQYHAGFVSGTPTIKLNSEKRDFDISPILRGLNGQNYTLLFVSRPVDSSTVMNCYGKMIQVRDACFAVSKRNLSEQNGTSHTTGQVNSTTDTNTDGTSTSKTFGKNEGINLLIYNYGYNMSFSKSSSHSHSHAETISNSVSDAINRSSGESHDVQNGFALEAMNYADKAIERLRQGQSNGMWESVITYSAETEMARNIIEACISGEMSAPNPYLLPARVMSVDGFSTENPLVIPKILNAEVEKSPICTMLTSEELGFISTPPVDSVPDFEVRIEKAYPLIADKKEEGIEVGRLMSGTRVLENMSFRLSERDLVRHTFICGITGSGKTTTVKRILDQAHKPFLVIESAKAEYRNLALSNGQRIKIYTLGRPELNCLQMNPFYIQNGVSPQAHIDMLKDLFNASFSFYGPMPYILEKCLQNIYRNKGWNLNLGFHPYLVNQDNLQDFFDADYTNKKYSMKSHQYLFPTMQDLKNEVERYVEEEMHYDGEVTGNIKSAIISRLESLCGGSKGYMFNTRNFMDMDQLLNENVVFEMEGLADDSDKAFSLGLLIIFISEYRQVKGKRSSNESPLAHLLVIEEAHRLLKNISTEAVSEDIGNPKGKAVEHFTNMIAEMRSYGQGVIVAEQIPTKLAPDVIKNTSNKIVQRIVAADDQAVIANTIGIPNEEAMQLGTLRCGEALCHKEGMAKPVKARIIQAKDIVMSNDMLYNNNVVGRINSINFTTLKEAANCYKSNTGLQTLRLLNSILMQNVDELKKTIGFYHQYLRKAYRIYGVAFVGSGSDRDLQTELMAENVEEKLLQGVYHVKGLLSDETLEALRSVIARPTEENLTSVRKYLWEAYNDDPIYVGKHIVSKLVNRDYRDGMDMRSMINNYFAVDDKKLTEEIIALIKGN